MVSERIVRAIYIKDKSHTSPWRTLPEVQPDYWITSQRRLIRRLVDRCTLCRRFTAKAASPLMATMPAARLQVFQPPFACTGVYYFGPIEVKLFRRFVKRLGCLFTCLTTRAVHLEMAYALDADCFICAYENFRVARATPKFIHCDNGTNFKGGQSWQRRWSVLIIRKCTFIWLSLAWSGALTHLRTPRILVEAGSGS